MNPLVPSAYDVIWTVIAFVVVLAIGTAVVIYLRRNWRAEGRSETDSHGATRQ